MLAPAVGSLKVLTGTKRLFIFQIDNAGSVAGPRGDLPSQLVPLNGVRFCYRESSIVPEFRFSSPCSFLLCIYTTTQGATLPIVSGHILDKSSTHLPVTPIDNETRCMVEYHQVSNEEVQAKLAELRQKGWTLVNIARAIGQAKRTVESWNQGTRSPANLQSVLASLDKLDKIKRVPKKKIYVKESHSEERHGNEGG